MPECCLCAAACVYVSGRVGGADRTGARQPKSVIAEVNIRCNQQMTTQKMEGAEMEGLGRCGRRWNGGGGARSTNMIIASFFFCFLLFLTVARCKKSSPINSRLASFLDFLPAFCCVLFFFCFVFFFFLLFLFLGL